MNKFMIILVICVISSAYGRPDVDQRYITYTKYPPPPSSPPPPTQPQVENGNGDEKETIIKVLPLPIPASQNGIYGYPGFPYAPEHPLFLNSLFGGSLNGYGPVVKASILASRSNPMINLLGSPYIKNVRENDGEDLPTLEEFEELLEKSTFGLSDFTQ